MASAAVAATAPKGIYVFMNNGEYEYRACIYIVGDERMCRCIEHWTVIAKQKRPSHRPTLNGTNAEDALCQTCPNDVDRFLNWCFRL
jgi:hypothetical protein